VFFSWIGGVSVLWLEYVVVGWRITLNPLFLFFLLFIFLIKSGAKAPSFSQKKILFILFLSLNLHGIDLGAFITVICFFPG